MVRDVKTAPYNKYGTPTLGLIAATRHSDLRFGTGWGSFQGTQKLMGDV